MAFRQIGIELESPLAVKLSLFEPYPRGVEFEVASGANNRKSGVSQ
jgi:hypothetical protein